MGYIKYRLRNFLLTPKLHNVVINSFYKVEELMTIYALSVRDTFQSKKSSPRRRRLTQKYLNPAVFGAAHFTGVVSHRLAGTAAIGHDAVACQSKGGQVFTHGLGALYGQGVVDAVAAGAVSVADHADLHGTVQTSGKLIEHIAQLRTQAGRVDVK